MHMKSVKMNNELYSKIDFDIVKLLVDTNGNLKAVNEDGDTSLMLAARAGRSEVAELILNKDKSVIDMQNRDGMTALMLALEAKQFETAELILHYLPDISLKNREGKRAASYDDETHSVSFSHLFQIVSLRRRDNKGMTLLMRAIRDKDFSIIDALIATDVMHVSEGEKTSLDIVDNNGGTALFYAVGTNNIEVTKLLLSNGMGPFVDMKDRLNNRALDLAIQNDNIEIVKLLLDAGANPLFNKNEFDYIWPLSGKNQTSIRKILVKAIIERSDKTNLIRAVISGNVKEVDNELKLMDGYGDAGHRLYVNAISKDGLTALTEACNRRNVEIVELLLRSNADPNIIDGHGYTALMVASKHGYSQIVELLIKFGANVNQKGQYGWTALMVAAIHRNILCVELLLMHKADIDIKDVDGNTAYDLAVAKRYTEIASILSPNGKTIANILRAAE